MARLTVISNRVGGHRQGAGGAGGLVAALETCLAPLDALWLGGSGRASRNPGAHLEPGGAAGRVELDLAPEQVGGGHGGFAGRALWPLLHGRCDLVRFEARELAAYRAANDAFARYLAPLTHGGDCVWVNGHHFLALGQQLRQRGVRGPVGFFLHVPFPPADLWRVLPRHRELAGALLHYDLVGFQTENDAHNFRQYASRHLGAECSADGSVETAAHRCRTGVFPVGIDTPSFRALAESAKVKRLINRLDQAVHGRLAVVGFDRLDYTKGLPYRLRAFERMLERHRDLARRVTLVQHVARAPEAAPESRKVEREVQALIGAINTRFGDLEWVPATYLHRLLSRARLAAALRLSRVGFVSPLSEGMNLVAKEYVAAQNAADPGVVVLSRFAGAAERLDGALLVNPYDIDATADTLAAALKMPLGERRARWQAMIREVEDNDVFRWRDTFLGALADAARTSRHAPAQKAAAAIKKPPARPGARIAPALLHKADPVPPARGKKEPGPMG